MKAAILAILFAAMGFMTVVFILNLRHGGPQAYYGASPTPVTPDLSGDPVLARMIPSEIKHSCPTCGECVHPVEILENRRTLSVTDHHRWFQLFNAADRTWYFEDPVFLAGCLTNLSAGEPKGFWYVRARIGPARHERGTPHECGSIASEFDAAYELCSLSTPYEEEFESVTPYLTLPTTLTALSKRYENCEHLPPVLHFAWRQAHGFYPGLPAPCACGKP
jgi:hypothetical protein